MRAPAATERAADRLARAREAAETVVDPELPFLTIVDMGILREVAIEGETVVVTITPTYSGCPAMDLIRFEVEVALEKAHVAPFRVALVYAPAWTTDWMTETARRKLAAHGIAPPAVGAGKRALFADDRLACPMCGSDHTRKVSDFSSTACKAHWMCLTCREPFEHFKCH